MDGKHATRLVDRVIAELAARQHGVVARRQLRALGVTSDEIDHRVHMGRFHRRHRGMYAVGHPVLAREGRWLAAVLACGPGAVLSHRSAAALWGIRPTSATRIDVTVPTAGGRARRDAIVPHRSPLPPEDVTERDGIPVTTLARTLLDLAEVVPARAVERTLDEADALRLLDARALTRTIERHPHRTGARRLTRTLHEHDPGTTLTRNDLEERFLALCDDHDLPRPLVNARFGRFIIDFLWPAERLAVETDGHTHHGTRAAFERDRARDARLTAAGLRVVRFTYRQVVADAPETAALLRRLLGA